MNRWGWGLKLFRMSLHAIPEDVRGESGGEMVETVTEHAAEAHLRDGGRRMARFWVKEAWAVLIAGVGMRLPGRTHRSMGRPGLWGTGPGRGGVETLTQDIRFALRTLRRRPLFTAVAVLTLGMGIGAATAMFSVVDGVLLRQLPYAEPQRLVNIWESFPRWREIPVLADRWDRVKLTGPEYRALKESSTRLQSLAVYNSATMTLTGRGLPRMLTAGIASASLLETLGTRPARGRWFLPDEEGAARGEGASVVVVSHELWIAELGADPDVLGQTLVLDDRAYPVVGVMPPQFHLRQMHPAMGEAADPAKQWDIWLPLGQAQDNLGPTNHQWEAVARLAPDVAMEDALAEVRTLVVGVDHDRDPANMRMVPRWEDETAGLASPLALLFGATGLLLLIACGNIATLSLGEMRGREHELAARAALGASRSRIVRQLLTESAVLGVMGSAVAAVVALAGTYVLVAMAPPIPRLGAVGVDGRVLAFCGTVGILAGLVFGTVPALVAGRTSVGARLNAAGRTRTGRTGGLQRAVVAVEVALTVMLLVGGGLMARSFSRLFAVDPGFNPQNAVTMRVSLPPSRYTEAQARLAFHQEALRRMEAVPGAEHVGAAADLPFPGSIITQPVARLGTTGSAELRQEVPTYYVLPGFFEAMGMHMLTGRALTEADAQGDLKGVVVSESLAQLFWPGISPLGARMRRFQTPFTVVGVVADVRRQRLGDEADPSAYFPMAADPRLGVSFVARGGGDVSGTIASMREAVWSVDPDVAVTDESTLSGLVARSAGEERYRTVLVGAFGLMAILLAAVGIFGVTARGVARRNREMGIRLALGASKEGLTGMVLSGSLVTAALGTTAGLIAAFWASRVLAGFLFGVAPWDPITYGIVAALVLATCLLASWVPARRATRVDPVEVLRAE